MKKIERGEYVRTKDGIIAQIEDIDYENKIYEFDRVIYTNIFGYASTSLANDEMFEKVIIKHSKQLIDLIEVGDFVNGYRVTDKYLFAGERPVLETEGNDTNCKCLCEKDIKTILTKEQYEANCYKVGGENE